jgi:tRNA wybutosine-synthesizing protein 2
VNTMRYSEFLRSRLGNSCITNEDLPTGYHVVGHVALLQLKSESMEMAQQIGDLTIEYDKRIRSVIVRKGPTKYIIRTPDYKLVAGDKNTTTIHVENGVKYRLDPLRITFSGGNKRERVHMSRVVEDGEYVVDMFACVGQFALQMAKRESVYVRAIEINPVAYEFLVENITLNHFEERVDAIPGDSRGQCPTGVANRIVMGYLHDTMSYLPTALQALSKKGGVIHMHLGCASRFIDDTCNTIINICREHFFQVEVNVRKIKNYAPGVGHFVFDITCSPP